MREDKVQPFPEELKKRYFDIDKLIKPMDWFNELNEVEDKNG